MMMLHLLMTISLWPVLLNTPPISAEPKVFATWDGFEADKLASIWLIKRFIAPEASIVIHPKGKVIKDAIQFDTPHASITRRFNKSTFEVFLEHYRIKDPKLVNIGKLIHDTEINTWERKMYRRTRELEVRVLDLMEKHKKHDELIAKACEYFDHLYATLPRELEPN
jgi:hypothetical protein